jgi:hypothetical protein
MTTEDFVMKADTTVRSTEAIPERFRQKIREAFPNANFSDLVIRYYDSVEDVGYEYFSENVVPSCIHARTVQYLEPFISFARLGKALLLETPESTVIYDTDHNDTCTEKGPFWFVMLKSQQSQ